MTFQFEQIPQDQIRIPGENYAHTATPYFRYENIINEVQSQIQGKPIYELKEVVEIRFAADPRYKPVFGAHEMWRCIDNRVITWAEKHSEQYRQFLAGHAQEAEGTPLEELQPYGITPAQLSVCRALQIYSIEALFHLEGPALKRLGIHGNALKPMAARYMDNKRDGSTAMAEIEALKRQLAELTGKAPQEIVASTTMIEDEAVALDGFEGLSDDQIKAKIAEITGSRPKGNPSRSTLISSLRELQDA